MRRLKKLLKWTAIGTAGLIALFLVFNAYYVWRTDREVEQRLASLREARQPISLAELTPRRIPPESNADVLLRRAEPEMEAIQKQLNAWYPRVGHPHGPLTDVDRQRLEGLYAAHPHLIEQLEQAAACPAHAPVEDFTVSPSSFLNVLMKRFDAHRLPYRVLQARVDLLVDQGRYEEAFALPLLVFRLAHQWLDEPLITNYMLTAVVQLEAVEMANQVLQAGPVSADSRRALDAELARLDTLDHARHALVTERGFSISAYQEIPASRYWLTRGVWNQSLRAVLDGYDRAIEGLRQPYHEYARGRVAPDGSRAQVLAALLDPSLRSTREIAERNRALSRCLRILSALQSQDIRGPATPDLRGLHLPPETLTDPFNGKPLIVAWEPRGWRVYSVGVNGVDDGGAFEKQADVGVGPSR